jgi:hypothetical protein
MRPFSKEEIRQTTAKQFNKEMDKIFQDQKSNQDFYSRMKGRYLKKYLKKIFKKRYLILFYSV